MRASKYLHEIILVSFSILLLNSCTSQSESNEEQIRVMQLMNLDDEIGNEEIDGFLVQDIAIQDFILSLEYNDLLDSVEYDTLYQEFWNAFVTIDTIPNDYLPKVNHLLNERLVFSGDTIIEYFNFKKAKNRIGVTQCKGNKPIIGYWFAKEKRIQPVNFLFFRYHELGHIALGHINCSRRHSNNLTLEIDADCYAMNLIEEKLMPNQANLVRIFLQGHFLGLNQRGEYDSRVRYSNLANSCSNDSTGASYLN